MAHVESQALQEKLRIRDASWDYKEVDTSWGVHGLHPYPAMMIFPVVRRFLCKLEKEYNVFLEPFV